MAQAWKAQAWMAKLEWLRWMTQDRILSETSQENSYRTCKQLAFLSECPCQQTDNGFTINSTFDDCGFKATHENGVLIFSNTVSNQPGNNFGLLLGPLTSISFDVSCKFFDQRKFWKLIRKDCSFYTRRFQNDQKVLLHHQLLSLPVMMIKTLFMAK